ncbi:MAG: Na+/H+ antiporter NhaC [Pseudohongiellaceae bacterium]
MTQSPADAPTQSSLLQAVLCFFGVIGIIATGLFLLGISLHSLMFLCLIWAGLHARYLGHSYTSIRTLMSDAIARALPAVYIFILIGMVIASFMHSGTIATLMYFGLDWLAPSLFLSVGMLLCAIMSLATGTSWGTVGTLGVVFIGIGGAMGIPLPLVAGMIVCGATFGDKMSPISDTTNLAAMSAGTNLYRHIYAMLFTTLPSFLLAFIVFLLLGSRYGDSAFAATQIAAIQTALAASYRLSPLVTLIPIVVLATLSVRKVPAEITMSVSVLVAVLIAILYQGSASSLVLNALWENTRGDTGIESLDDLLGRGGIYSMSWTLMLALMALALGGILHGAGFLATLLSGIIKRIQHVAALIATTICSGLIGNMAMGEAYISIILNCQLFREKYEQSGLDKAILSRSVEEGSTLTTGLIPWTTTGVFYAATLGVPVLDYLPYAFFNYFNVFVAVGFAMLGIGLLRRAEPQDTPAVVTPN